MGPVTVPIQQTVRLVGFGEKFLARAEVSQDQPESNYSSYQFIIVGFYGCSAWVIENSSDPPGDRLILSWPLVRIVNQIHKRCFFRVIAVHGSVSTYQWLGHPRFTPYRNLKIVLNTNGDVHLQKWGGQQQQPKWGSSCSQPKINRDGSIYKLI